MSEDTIMSAKASGFDLLGSIKNPQTPLYLTLIGFRKTLARHMGLKVLPYIMHDNPKAVVRREQKSDFPYGYFRITSFEIQRDQQANKTIRRHASSMTLDDVTNASISKAYLFPCVLNIEMHFMHNSPTEVLSLIEKTAILGAVDGLSFTASMKGSSDWMVGIALEEGPVSIPETSLEDESDAAAFDLTFRFRVSTRVGVVKDVPKVNNEGKVTRSIGPDENNLENF